MKFLRVCHKDDLYWGMYRGKGGKGTWACEAMNYNGDKHPIPYDDPGLSSIWGDYSEKGYLFAFPGVTELKKWIYDPDFYKCLEAEGFYPHWIEAKGFHGWYQSIFDPTTVDNVQMWRWEEI